MKKCFLLMLIVLLAAGASFAQMPEEVKRELNLSDKQSEKIDQAMIEFKKTSEKLYLDMQEQELKFKREMLSQDADLDRIRAVIQKKHQFAAQLEIEKIKNILRIKSVMSEKQFQRWKDFEKVKMVYEERERQRREELRMAREMNRQKREDLRISREYERQKREELRQIREEERRTVEREKRNANLKQIEEEKRRKKKEDDGFPH